jgi:probable phosphoglycerate mutase
MPSTGRSSARLLLLRHGESEWNATGRWQGQADPPLSEAGVRHAMAAADRLGAIDAIWSSTLQRAALTAAIIAESLGVGPVVHDHRLQETHVGPWQGLTLSEVEAGWPGYLADHRRPEGAEPLEAVVDRATACLRDIAGAHPDGEVLVLTHAGVIRTLRRAILGADRRYPNLGGCWLRVERDGSFRFGDDVVLVGPSDEPSADPGATL